MSNLTEEDIKYIAAEKLAGVEFADNLTHEDVEFFRRTERLMNAVEFPPGHFKGMLSDPNSFRLSGEYEDGDAP